MAKTAREILTGGETRKLLFIAVSTGQAIANLPPVVELAEAGDHVLWLETPLATRGDWSAGAKSVISKRNRGIFQSEVGIQDYPHTISAVLEKELERFPESEWRTLVVGNGGTKPINGAIGTFLERSKRAYAVAYTQSQPSEFWLQTDGMAGPVARLPLLRSGLNLAEVLECSGHQFFADKASGPIRLWPMGERLPDSDKYGVDPGATHYAHAHAVELAELRSAAELGRGSFEAASRFHPDKVQRFRDLILSAYDRPRPSDEQLAAILDTGLRRLVDDLPAPQLKDKVIGKIFHHAVFTAQFAALSALRAEKEIPRADSSLGARFELAVARRVQAWIGTANARFPVNEAWWGVKIAPSGNPSRTVAEFDIVFVLSNGTLLALECKSYLSSEGVSHAKDFDARLFNLQKTGSRLARIAICAPIYSAFAGEEWFDDLHKNVRDRTAPPFDFIGFTLPDQPESYQVEYNASGGVDTRSFSIPSFEDALDRLFSRFVLGT